MKNPNTLIPTPPALCKVRLTDEFFLPFTQKIASISAPDILKKFEADGALENYRRVIRGEAGTGTHDGPPWFHGLICETIRGISDLLVHHYDPALDQKLDEIIDLIAKAADCDPDGYLNPYTTLKDPRRRWGLNGGNILAQHETYNAGCLCEAGVHHYLATGKTVLLAVAVRMWNYLADFIGAPPRHNVTTEHSLPEEALIKMADLFDSDPALCQSLNGRPAEYRRVALFFIESKGHDTDRATFPRYFGEYSQDHRPVRDQHDAVGHAVRATLFYCGLATVALDCGDESLRETAMTIWQNIVTSKLHANGCVGALRHEEKFGEQYSLPNHAYLETCAGVGLTFFGFRLHRLYPEASIYDVLEGTLRNLMPASVSETFDHYTYENPLISDGDFARWSWHKCPCCPPMLLKLTGMLPQLVYSQAAGQLWVNLYADSVYENPQYTLRQTGKVFEILPVETDTLPLTLRFRIPSYAQNFRILKNGVPAPVVYETQSGYAVLSGTFSRDTRIQVCFDTPILRWEAHPLVAEDRGQVMVRKGPVLYCAEQIDNPTLMSEDGKLNITLSATEPLRDAPGDRIVGQDVNGQTVTLIPYYRWNNRGKGQMRVWLGQQNLVSDPCRISDWEGKLYRPLKTE